MQCSLSTPVATTAALFLFGISLGCQPSTPDEAGGAVPQEESSDIAQGPRNVMDLVADPTIQGWVEELFLGPPGVDAMERLRKVGTRAEPFLVAGLNDPRILAFVSSGRDGRRTRKVRKALERFCELIGPLGTRESVPRPLELLAARSPDASLACRAEIVGALGKIGAESSADAFAATVALDDVFCPRSGLAGLRFALDQGRLDDSARSAFFRALAPLIELDKGTSRHSLPRTLLKLDRHKGREVLMLDRHLSIDSPLVGATVEALLDDGAPVPVPKVVALVDAAAHRALPESRSPHQLKLYASLLGSCAHLDDSATRERLEGATDHPHMDVRRASATALLHRAGFVDVGEGLRRRRLDLGYAALGAEERIIASALDYDSCVRLGGHAEFRTRSFEAAWPDVIKGLEALGLKVHLQIFQEALEIYRASGEGFGPEVRLDRWGPFSDDEVAALDALGPRYMAAEETVELSVLLYVLRHPEPFSALLR